LFNQQREKALFSPFPSYGALTRFHSCSVSCSRIHRENHPPDPEKPIENVADDATTRTPAKNTDDSGDPYRILVEHNADIKKLFKKWPNLKADLIQILGATLPPQDTGGDVIRSGLPFKLQNPGALSGKKQPTWTRDEGLRRATEALREARTNPGDKGDGVREYCELVWYLLSRPGGTKLASSAREAAREEEEARIKKLIEEEKSHD
jgi:hypothetical protein